MDHAGHAPYGRRQLLRGAVLAVLVLLAGCGRAGCRRTDPGDRRPVALLPVPRP
jgi:hypothetical protein